MVVAVARRLGLIGRSGSDGVIRWLIDGPKGGETQCSGILIYIGGPALTIQGTMRSIPETWARASRIGKDYLLPWFTDGNPTSKYVTFAVLIVEPSMATWYMVPMPSMIDIYDLKLFYTLYTYSNNKWFVLNVSSILGYYKVKPYPPTCVVLCDGTWIL